MTTALTIINRAAEILGYKDPRRALNGNDAQTFLDALNSMVDSWATAAHPLFVYAASELVQTVSGSPVTIGAGATLDTPRPVNIPSGGFFRVGDIDYHFETVTREQYASLDLKSTTTSYPRYCYYEATLPTGKLHFYPVPDGAGELHLPIEQRLQAFADISTDYTLAPGVRSALEYSLAEELAPGRRQLDPQIARMAATKRRSIQTFDAPMLTTEFDSPRGWNILTNGY